MISRSLRHAFVVLLGVFVTFGMGLSAIQAGGMAAKTMPAADTGAKMVMASDMSSGQSDCGGCAMGGGDGVKAMACASACMTPAFAVPPQTLAVTFIVTAVDLPLPGASIVPGRSHPPDPYPPRSFKLG